MSTDKVTRTVKDYITRVNAQTALLQAREKAVHETVSIYHNLAHELYREVGAELANLQKAISPPPPPSPAQ